MAASGAERLLVERALATLEEGCRRIARGDEAIETVHQARVGARRLRTMLRLFGKSLGKPKRRRLKELSGALAEGLGGVRDRDVLLRHLGTLRPGGDPRAARALGFARNRARMEREDALHPMRESVARFLAEARPARRAAAQGAGVARAGLNGPIRQALGELYGELLESEAGVLSHADFEAAHRMRIAAKRLRYALETVREVLPAAGCRALDAGIELATRVQGRLGHVQDHHVWGLGLRALSKETRRSLGEPALTQGLALLAASERRKRDRELARFVERWRRHRAEEDGPLALLDAWVSGQSEGEGPT
ncbi:MAG: CHAD domain-containing protein [Candidatus Wallbacteria bacterium]|nr:CHAD domain-containing protein [Candidatus Wallbacteria bacterium]